MKQVDPCCARAGVPWAMWTTHPSSQGFPGGASGKESACQCRRQKRHCFDLWVGKIPWSRSRQTTPVFLSGKFHGQRSLADYSPWGCKESNTTEHTRVCVCVCVCVLFIIFMNKFPKYKLSELNPFISVTACYFKTLNKCQMNRGMYLTLMLSYLLKCRSTLLKKQ